MNAGGYLAVTFTGGAVSQMEGWLGGKSFSWTVSCGGTMAAQAQAQVVGQACEE
jgi:hypothetical protein